MEARTLLKVNPLETLAAHREEFRAPVLAHRPYNARVFHSVLLGLDTEVSDLDILVDVTVDTTLFGLGAIRYRLPNLLGVPVHVVTPNGLSDRVCNRVVSEAICI